MKISNILDNSNLGVKFTDFGMHHDVNLNFCIIVNFSLLICYEIKQKYAFKLQLLETRNYKY